MYVYLCKCCYMCSVVLLSHCHSLILFGSNNFQDPRMTMTALTGPCSRQLRLRFDQPMMADVVRHVFLDDEAIFSPLVQRKGQGMRRLMVQKSQTTTVWMYHKTRRKEWDFNDLPLNWFFRRISEPSTVGRVFSLHMPSPLERKQKRSPFGRHNPIDSPTGWYAHHLISTKGWTVHN